MRYLLAILAATATFLLAGLIPALCARLPIADPGYQALLSLVLTALVAPLPVVGLAAAAKRRSAP